MTTTHQEFIRRRAITLAQEFLTRRPDVQLHAFEKAKLDAIVSIGTDPDGFLPFAVAVEGTDQNFATSATASRYLSDLLVGGRKNGHPVHALFMPAVALLYSVRTNAGYWAWLAEPKLVEGRAVLRSNGCLSCVLIEQDSLDAIVEDVSAWYDSLADLICVNG